MKIITIPTIQMQAIVDNLLQKPKKPADMTSFCTKIYWDALSKAYTNGKDAALDRTLFNTNQPYAGYLTDTKCYSLVDILEKCHLITVSQRLVQIEHEIQSSLDKGIDWTYISQEAKEAVKLHQNTKVTRLFSLKTEDLDWGWVLHSTKPITNQEVADRLLELISKDKTDDPNQPAPKEIAYQKVIQRNDAKLSDIMATLKDNLPVNLKAQYYVKMVDYNPDHWAVSTIHQIPSLAKAVDDINQSDEDPVDSPYLLIRLNDYHAIVIVALDDNQELSTINEQMNDKLTYYDWKHDGTFDEDNHFKHEVFKSVDYDDIEDQVKQMLAQPVKA